MARGIELPAMTAAGWQWISRRVVMNHAWQSQVLPAPVWSTGTCKSTCRYPAQFKPTHSLHSFNRQSASNRVSLLPLPTN